MTDGTVWQTSSLFQAECQHKKGLPWTPDCSSISRGGWASDGPPPRTQSTASAQNHGYHMLLLSDWLPDSDQLSGPRPSYSHHSSSRRPNHSHLLCKINFFMSFIHIYSMCPLCARTVSGTKTLSLFVLIHLYKNLFDFGHFLMSQCLFGLCNH